MAKYYAVKKGMNPETMEPVENLIFRDWPTAQMHIKGVSGAQYKSFTNQEDAKAYLGSADPLMHKEDALYSQTALHVYVDGSVNMEIPNYSYGLVCVKDGQLLHTEHAQGSNPEAIRMRQIGGELLGAMKGLVYAKKHGYQDVVIFHDYAGICYHATGYWKRNDPHSEKYHHWMQRFFEDNPTMLVTFCKVDAHTGDDFNELADGLAKQALGLTPDEVFYKVAEKHKATL